jgi:hypothetical protein
MHPLLLAAFLILPPTNPPKPPQSSALEVVIQGDKIVIPHLPTTVGQANSEWGVTGPLIQRGLQDLKRDLLQLIGSDLYKLGAPTSLRVPAKEAEATRFFAKMLNDNEFADLRGKTIEAWNDWQAALVESGLSRLTWPSAGEAKATPQPIDRLLTKKEQVALTRRLAQLKNFSEGSIQDGIAYNQELASFQMAGQDSEGLRSLQRDSEAAERRILTSVQVMSVNNQMTPALAESWTPLREYLNACATKLEDLDSLASPLENDGLLRLRFQAKVAFMERCRATLWFSQRVWTRMTSRSDPAPLRKLR